MRVGDRILVNGGRIGDFGRQYTGQVKYVGRVDKEVTDFGLHVGLKLDDKIGGDCDGVYKGKRYFRCTEGHGCMLPLKDVVSVLASRLSASTLSGSTIAGSGDSGATPSSRVTATTTTVPRGATSILV